MIMAQGTDTLKNFITLAHEVFLELRFPCSPWICHKFNVEKNTKQRKAFLFFAWQNRDGARTKLPMFDIYNQNFLKTFCGCMCDIIAMKLILKENFQNQF